MWKSFDSFVALAAHNYGLRFLQAGKQIEDRLKQAGLTPFDVVCYINWADGDCLLQLEIAKKLNTYQQRVSRSLDKLKLVWPHLFEFGSKVPPFNHRRSGHGNTMGRLRCDAPQGATKF